MPRQARRKSSSGIYHVILRGVNQQQIFYDFGMISKAEFVRFNNENGSDECLDIGSKPIIKVTDEEAQRIIEKISKCKNAAEFQRLSKDIREKNIKKFHEKGISIRQVSRLCGESKGMVEKWS